MAHTTRGLPPEITVLERGWLSANHIVFRGNTRAPPWSIPGYCAHAAQTVALLASALEGRALERILNTHLHSDHCGGNAALQAHWPGAHTSIPPGQAAHVHHWDAYALSYTPTGQDARRSAPMRCCSRAARWCWAMRPGEIHAAPGHDTHAIVLFEPTRARPDLGRCAVGERLWRGLPQLEGEAAFAEVAATLDLIERLAPRTVIPGHGAVFTDTPRALAVARRRLDGFARAPAKRALYAAKVLLKYKLLEWQQISLTDLSAWASATPYFGLLHQRHLAIRPSPPGCTAWPTTWCARAPPHARASCCTTHRPARGRRPVPGASMMDATR